MDVNHRLSSLQLPDGWSAAGERSGFVWFALPSVYSRIDDPYLDHNFFTVHPMVSDVCDKRYADAQAAMQAGTPIPPVFRPSPFQNQGKMVGYTWLAYGGAGASGPPDWREWCVHVATSASDLDITAIKADTRTVSFIEHTFIPLWIKEFP